MLETSNTNGQDKSPSIYELKEGDFFTISKGSVITNRKPIVPGVVCRHINTVCITGRPVTFFTIAGAEELVVCLSKNLEENLVTKS